VPLLVYQIDFDIPLGFPNEVVLVAAAATLGAATRRLRRVDGAGAARFSGEVTTTDGSGCDAEPELDCCADAALPASAAAANAIDAAASRE